MFKKTCTCGQLGILDPDNINHIKPIIIDTIHIFMSSHGRQSTNTQHQREILLLLGAFLFFPPLIDTAEKIDNEKKKGRGGGREGGLLPVA